MKGGEIETAKNHQESARHFAKKYVEEKKGKNRKHVLDTYMMQIKSGLKNKYKYTREENPDLVEPSDKLLEEEAQNTIAAQDTGGRRRRKTRSRKMKRRYTKKR